MRTWTPRQWVAAVAVALVAAAAIGVPTGVVPTPFYARMTPVLWWNYPVWVAASLLMGLLVATYVNGPPAARPDEPRGRRALLAGVLSAFAVGCRRGSAGLQDSAPYDERSLVPEAPHSGGEGSDGASAG
ncbi:putative integral membrane protein [Streptomyces himastatinicus ATCC 53653]|uniref:Putative integral membrane protein n=1 Tax=Streptomyces himastatinicus ATCC 53653 TaxID=457427 RepID=D9WIW0_9ACTN|nr:putative integral membrane protein [Streptomyces himastatinicus ATCC 53653]